MKILSKNAKLLLGLVVAAVLIAALCIGIPKISSAAGRKARNAAAQEAIAEIMESYGLTDYQVINADGMGVDVLCKDFKSLRGEDQLALLKETLGMKDIEVNGTEIDLACNFYVNSQDHYYYVSPFQLLMPGTSYKCAGVYCSNGHYCVYEE